MQRFLICLLAALASVATAQAETCDLEDLNETQLFLQLGLTKQQKTTCPFGFQDVLDAQKGKVTLKSLLDPVICSVPVRNTQFDGIQIIGKLNTEGPAPGNADTCTLSYIGDGRLLTAAHCLTDRHGDWKRPAKTDGIQMGLDAGQNTILPGCRATRFCVTQDWHDHSDNRRARDIGFVQVSGCDFDGGAPVGALTLTALPIAELERVAKVRLTGYLNASELDGRTCFSPKEDALWTSLQNRTKVVHGSDGGGLLCHLNPTLEGTSGAPITDAALREVFCVHSYPSSAPTGCKQDANACSIVTEADVQAITSATATKAPQGYVCADITYDSDGTPAIVE